MSRDPRLIVDGRPLVGNRTGIGVHVAEVLARLGFDPAPVVASHAPIENLSRLEGVELRVDRSLNGITWQQFRLPSIARRVGAGVLWGPHGTIPWTIRIPAVVTIHDLTSIMMPRLHSLKTIFSFNVFIGRSLSIATKIVAVSRHTAEMVERGFDVPRAKIEIVPNAASSFFSPGPADELPDGLDPGSYILFVGTVEPRKGVADLLDAWEALSRPRPRLVVAGGRGWKLGALEQRIESLGPDVVRTGRVTDAALRSLYRGALFTVYPSHYEGFGIPVLEAMQCGSPVITTTGGALPEVAGDAAILVEPGRPDELQRAIGRVLESPDLRRDLAARGQQRSRHFSWDASAESYATIFREAARSTG